MFCLEAARGIATACSPADTNTVDGYEEADTPHAYAEMHYSVMFDARASRQLRDAVNVSDRGDSWLATLGDWSDALALHEEKLQVDANDMEAAVGCMRCYSANGDWSDVLDLANDYTILPSSQELADDRIVNSRRKALRMCAKAAWRLGQWSDLEGYASQLTGEDETARQATTIGDNSTQLIDYEGAFYMGVLHIHRKEWTKAASAIDAARQAMDGRLTALMAESYSRSYPSMVQAQTLSEMEEIIEFRKAETLASSSLFSYSESQQGDAKSRLKSVWKKRLAGCRSDVDVLDSVLAVRSLVLGPDDDVESVIKLSELARQNKRHKFGERILLEPLRQLGADLNGQAFGFSLPEQLAIAPSLGVDADSALPPFIENIVCGDASRISFLYDQGHEEFTREIVQTAGGAERFVMMYDGCMS